MGGGGVEIVFCGGSGRVIEVDEKEVLLEIKWRRRERRKKEKEEENLVIFVLKDKYE